MIDNQGKIRGRVSIIDIIIVLVVLALVAGFVYRRATPHISDIIRGETPFYVTFEVNRIRSVIAEDSVVVGDKVFRQHATRQALGTIVNIEHMPATEVMMRTDGTAILATMEERYSLRITIQATGSITNSGFFVNGNDHLSPGGEVAIINNRFIFPLARVYYVGTERPQ
ncbi:MAG: DUF4330 domain-containing protein [Defluviitaleaceae bacterium]|nr:DUF4330 domain-containing protein [Defluviitaleaceae bacterium]